MRHGILKFVRLGMLGSAGLTALIASAAFAEPPPAATTASAPVPLPGGYNDIIVTARKRDETSIAVPVAITAVGAQELSRRAINTLDGIARIVPQLVIAENGGSGQGGTIALRGISGPDNNNFGDQAVSFNIDGFQIAKSSVRRIGEMDIAQVEVLKGPQALFFGKNSPGGVVSITTADPTNRLEARMSTGYEFNAHEWRSEGYVSVPITDALGVRLAGYYSRMRGWVENTYPAGDPLSPRDRFGPRRTEFALRGTVKYNDGGPFSARLKLNYGKVFGSGPASNFQPISCPVGGQLQFPGASDDCKANSRISHPDIGTSFTPYEPAFGDGQTRLRNRQSLASLELNYNLSDAVRLTSLTGYYKVNGFLADQFNYPSPVVLLPSVGFYTDREWSQELRLASSFSSPLNFTVGGIYSNTRATNRAHTLFGANPPVPTPLEFNDYFFLQKGEAYSFFGQLQWKIIPTVELAGGGRYSHEEKRLPLVLADFTGNPARSPSLVLPSPARIGFNDFSPEVTLSWRPANLLTVYASYKRGFLSGGFNASSDALVPGARPDYGPQKVRGFEGGLKAALFDKRLRINFAIFNYHVLGLQVNSFEAGISSIRNAGQVAIKGAELDFNYRTPVDGLDLHGAAAYTHARYQSYFAPCYVGQTQALGCDLTGPVGSPVAVAPSGVGTLQNLAGSAAPNAPDWVVNGGINYLAPISPRLKAGFSIDVNYSSSYVTDSKNSPGSRPPAQAIVDASVRVAAADDRWEIALIGRNLTNRFYWNNSQDLFPSGAGTGGGPGTVSVLGDRFAVVSRAREIMLRVSVKY